MPNLFFPSLEVLIKVSKKDTVSIVALVLYLFIISLNYLKFEISLASSSNCKAVALFNNPFIKELETLSFL